MPTRAQQAMWEKAYRERNREKINARQRERMRNDPEARKRKDEQNRKWQQNNPDKVKAIHERWIAKPGKREHRRDYLRASIYGITKEQYWQMFDEQGGKCFICKLEERRTYKGRVTNLVVDHNHTTDEVRRLLCHACNASLGFLDEDPVRMQRMIEYVEQFNKRTAER